MKKKMDEELAGLLGSLGAFTLGSYLLLDDGKDLGLFSTEDHPSPLHHWIVGLGIMLGGVGGICAFGIKLLEKINKEKK